MLERREGVNCERMQPLVVNLLQRSCSWQKIREEVWVPRPIKYSTMNTASLDVKTPIDVAVPEVVVEILEWTIVHGHRGGEVAHASETARWS